VRWRRWRKRGNERDQSGTSAAGAARPADLRKGDFVADKNEQVVFKVATDATKPEVKAAVEALFKVRGQVGSGAECEGQGKRFGRTMGRRKDWKKAFRVPEARPGNQLCGWGVISHGTGKT
jgi:large subunit ribosomal protein L23